MLSEELKDYILNLEKPQTQCDCLNNFKNIYKKHSIDEWINSDLSFELVNFIMFNRADLLSLAIRINVQINLFLRTINKFSERPDEIFDNIKYSIGCFALTEKNTGVLSGLFLETEFEELEDGYKLNTNNIYKNWISQGNYSDYSIVFAINKDDNKDMRIFLVDMNNERITRNKIDDLQVTQSLDLSRIEFNNLIISKDSLLEKSKGEKKINLLNGIFYGRYMIAEATISSILGLINHIEKNIDSQEKFKKLKLTEYLEKCKSEYENYRDLLSTNRKELLTTSNVLLINCYKIYVIEKSIEVYNNLHLLFGTRALTYSLTYENLIFNKVAEGDTSVLRMSLVINHLRSGITNMLFTKGLSFLQILLLNSLNKEEQFLFVTDNLKQISDTIILDNIRELKI